MLSHIDTFAAMSTFPGQSYHNGIHQSHSGLMTASDLHHPQSKPLPDLGCTPSQLSTMNNECNVNNNSNGLYAANGSIHSNGHHEAEASADDAPCIDIIINNVVCAFNTKCHINLKKVAMEGAHVEYKRENGMLNMKLRNPNVTASIWSSGKITCTGSTSEEAAKLASRRIGRRLQRLGFNVRFCQYRVVNVLGTCSLPFAIRLNQFSVANKARASYEPEIHPGVTYRLEEPKATLKVFSTGSITVTAPCVLNVQLAIEHIYPLVEEFKMEPTRVSKKVVFAEKKYLKKKEGVVIPHGSHFAGLDAGDDDDDLDDFDDESDFSDYFDSDESLE